MSKSQKKQQTAQRPIKLSVLDITETERSRFNVYVNISFNLYKKLENGSELSRICKNKKLFENIGMDHIKEKAKKKDDKVRQSQMCPRDVLRDNGKNKKQATWKR